MALRRGFGMGALSLRFSKKYCCILTGTRCVEPIQVHAYRGLGSLDETPLKPPKRPTNAFILYVDHLRKLQPDIQYNKLLPIASKEWADMNEEDKKSYFVTFQENKAKYIEDKAEYDQQMKEYLLTLTDEQRAEQKKEPKKQKLKKKGKKEKHPIKPKSPGSSYAYFIKEKTSHNELHPGQQREKIASFAAEWNAMTDEEKEPYKESYRRRKEIYINEMETWEKQMLEAGRGDLVRVKTRKQYAASSKEADD